MRICQKDHYITLKTRAKARLTIILRWDGGERVLMGQSVY